MGWAKGFTNAPPLQYKNEGNGKSVGSSRWTKHHFPTIIPEQEIPVFARKLILFDTEAKNLCANLGRYNQGDIRSADYWKSAPLEKAWHILATQKLMNSNRLQPE